MKTIHTCQVLFAHLQLQRAVATSPRCHLATSLPIIQISTVGAEIRKCENSKYQAIEMPLTYFKYYNMLFNINLWLVYSITQSNIYVTFECNVLINYTFFFKNSFKINHMPVLHRNCEK